MPKSVLEQFLDNCQNMGWLSLEERTLLVRFKIDGFTSRQIAGRNGNAAAAVRHRIQTVARTSAPHRAADAVGERLLSSSNFFPVDYGRASTSEKNISLVPGRFFLFVGRLV